MSREADIATQEGASAVGGFRMKGVLAGVLLGAAAGAAGTTMLNAVTYLDMVVRGRPASSTPQDTVEALAKKAHISIPGYGEDRTNRVTGLGSLTGISAGVGTGALLGLARAAGYRPGKVVSGLVASVVALLGTNGPMTVLGVTDPRTWEAKDWVADVIPHLAYGFLTAVVLDYLDCGSGAWPGSEEPCNPIGSRSEAATSFTGRYTLGG